MRRVLEDDAARGQLLADRVGAGEVAGLAGRRALGHQRVDRGVVAAAFGRAGRMSRVRCTSPSAPSSRSRTGWRNALAVQRLVDPGEEHVERGQGAGGVEVVGEAVEELRLEGVDVGGRQAAVAGGRAACAASRRRVLPMRRTTDSAPCSPSKVKLSFCRYGTEISR